MIVDCHTHAFPDFLAPKAIPALAANSGLTPFHDGTANGLLALMDRCGIDRAVVLSIATKPTQEHSVNAFAVSLLEQPRLIPFGSVFPSSDTWREQLEALKTAGIRGIKLHPEYQQFDLDTEAALAVYRRCGELGLLVQFHAGMDAAFEPPVHTGAARINRVCELCPETTFIAAHFGGYDMWEDAAANLNPHANLYLDTSMTRTAAKIQAETARRIVTIHGADHILLGSDSPWELPGDSVAGVRALNLSPEDTAAILGGNAERLLALR